MAAPHRRKPLQLQELRRADKMNSHHTVHIVSSTKAFTKKLVNGRS